MTNPNQFTNGTALLSVPQRFFHYVEFTDSCWLWTGAKSRGYGSFKDSGAIQAHRWAYEFCIGPIPDGLTIDHLCRVHACVFPDHMEVVTGRVNTLRGIGPTAVHARKTHCPQGHPYDDKNTRMEMPTGRLPFRRCRICQYHHERTYYERHRRAKRVQP